jgi:hypothetical protein
MVSPDWWQLDPHGKGIFEKARILLTDPARCFRTALKNAQVRLRRRRKRPNKSPRLLSIRRYCSPRWLGGPARVRLAQRGDRRQADQVLAMTVEQRRHRLALCHVDATADQRKVILGEIDDALSAVSGVFISASAPPRTISARSTASRSSVTTSVVGRFLRQV